MPSVRGLTNKIVITQHLTVDTFIKCSESLKKLRLVKAIHSEFIKAFIWKEGIVNEQKCHICMAGDSCHQATLRIDERLEGSPTDCIRTGPPLSMYPRTSLTTMPRCNRTNSLLAQKLTKLICYFQ